MTTSPTPTRTIEVTEDVYDMLARTAASRDTDLNGALRYLIEVPATPAASSGDDDE